MCSGAIVNARLDRVVFGARDPKAGGTKTLYEILSDNRLNHQVDVTEGVLADEASQLLKTFFFGRLVIDVRQPRKLLRIQTSNFFWEMC